MTYIQPTSTYFFLLCHSFVLFLNHSLRYRHCPYSMRRRVYVTVGRPSVRLSKQRRVCCCVPGGRRCWSTAARPVAGGKQQPHRSKCGQCHVVSCTLEAGHRPVYSVSLSSLTITYIPPRLYLLSLSLSLPLLSLSFPASIFEITVVIPLHAEWNNVIRLI